MRVLAVVHKGVPVHNAGAEWMLHAILRDLVARGHRCFVAAHESPGTYTFEGVTYFRTEAHAIYRVGHEVDVVMTHLDRTQLAVNVAAACAKPLVHLVHNDRQIAYHHVKPGPHVLAVFNSEWIRDRIPWGGANLVCIPPVFVDEYQIEPDTEHGAVTLLNLTAAKGAHVFYELARRRPADRFLGVLGAYGVQQVGQVPGNVELRANTPNVRDVYARTRVLLVPSSYESWGRVAVEAACSGIPVVASPTPGLLEALDGAAIFADPARRHDWLAALERLDDPDEYATWSARALGRARALEVEAREDLDQLARRLEHLLAGYPEAAQAAAYDRAMPILDSIAATGRRCRVCGAENGTCGAESAAHIVEGFDVTPAAVSTPGPMGVYRTASGDFRYREADAKRLGLIPDGPKLSPVVARRIRVLAGPQLAAEVTRVYAGVSDTARAAFLEELALHRDVVARDRLPEMVERLEQTSPAAPEPDHSAGEEGTAGEDVPDGRAGDVLAWAGDDPERAAQALTVEQGRSKPRTRLVAALERIIGNDR